MWKNSFLLMGLLVICPVTSGASTPRHLFRGEIRIMWYNVENMFHPTDDSLQADDEFTPAGLMHWTWERYQSKITRLAKVVVAAGEWDPPDLVGLCEVEDARVLEDLVSHPVLKPYGYKILHRECHDHRGMEVACIYREKRISVKGWWVYPPSLSGSRGRTRDHLHICATWNETDTLELFLVHFISKYGGAGATAEYRRMQARSLVRRIDSVLHHRAGSLVIVAGDFNEEYGGYSMEPFRPAFRERDWERGRDSFIYMTPSGMEGSYKYRGRWSCIDQFLVAGRTSHLLMKVSIMHLTALLKPDEKYQGMKPSRTYEGFSYNGGISDHLPLVMDVTHRSFPAHSER